MRARTPTTTRRDTAQSRWGPRSPIMKRLSTPMFGGLVSLVLLTLFVVPAIHLDYAGRRERRADAPP